MKLPRHVFLTRCFQGSFLVMTMLGTGCGGAIEESSSSIRQEATGALTISGIITDSTGSALPGVVVSLTGAAQASVTTGSNGGYSFTSLAAASYTVRPVLGGCAFLPFSSTLNLKTSTTLNFRGLGLGLSCVANSGATSGALTLSGRVLDTAGNPVPAVRISLAGNAQAVRTTSASGSYSFQVGIGSYSLRPIGPCSFTPSVAKLNNLRASQTQNFVGGAGCKGVPAMDGGVADSGRADAAQDSRSDVEAAVDGARADATVDAAADRTVDGNVTADAKIDVAPDSALDSGAPDTCAPTTCAASGKICGALATGCGATLQCGTCPAGSTCNADGTQCTCVPKPASVACTGGQNCGTASDGCGGVVDCGTCTQQGDTCGGGGVPGRCGGPCDLGTMACFQSRDKAGQPPSIQCTQCAVDSGCFDPSVGGTCELVTTPAPIGAVNID